MKQLYSNNIKNIDALLKLPFHIYCKDINYKYLACSSLMAENLNLNNISEIIGLSDFDTIIPKTSADEFRKQDKILLKDPSIKLFSDSATYKEEEMLEFITLKLPLFNQIGILNGVLGLSIPLLPSSFVQLKNISNVLNINLKKILTGSSKRNQVLFFNKKETLSKREKECLLLLVKGYTARMIADHYGLSKRTIEGYLEQAKNKLGCDTRQKLIQYTLEKYYIYSDRY